MPRLRILCRDSPQRTIALTTSEYALVFQHSLTSHAASPTYTCSKAPRCLVEFSSLSRIDTNSYRLLGYGYGTLGLITVDEDVFVCVVTGSSQAATVRPGETISRISNVDFFCLTQAAYEDGLVYESETQFAADEFNRIFGLENRESATDHPLIALKKLLSDGSFYYSRDFNLTDRIQNRFDKSRIFDIETLNEDMLWNSYMISPLLHFRSRLPSNEKLNLDSSQILTSVIRGFSSTMRIPTSISRPSQEPVDLSSTLTIVSRQSSRRAGTRFNSRGIDDHGNVANFVETEIVLWIPSGLTFSYVQIRGSVPVFWEQAPGFLPGQQRIEVTRSTDATQHAFSKHFELLGLEYGSVHVVNLLSEEKPGEAELSLNFRNHIRKGLRKLEEGSHKAEFPTQLQLTEYDFHAEARGPLGYDVGSQLKQELERSLSMFAYFLGDDANGTILESEGTPQRRLPAISQQKGIFRTNCLDCLDRTNLIQSIISSAVLESFLHRQGRKLTSDIQRRHSSLWADNGDALSKIYAGTGAIKSSFTRHGKMSFAGALADARKSATRLYVNNFSDKLRQNTIDLLLGQLTNQVPVYLYDPINDLVSEEVKRRASEYTYTKPVNVWAGTFNVNGRNEGLNVDLTPWLFPLLDQRNDSPTIFAVAFQEIVPLNPQQIMSTDPTTRKVWENTVSCCLNDYLRLKGNGRYVLLRSSQLVGAALMVYVKEDALSEIKNVEASTKKAGFQGISGNKGGCAIRLEYSSTRICFVTAHLAAGFANCIERNRDYETILQGLMFQRNRSIEDHDTVLWLGDFNYRINLSNECARELVQQRDYQRLYDMDQLNHQMATGMAFRSYSEGPIRFPPTYKYDVGTNVYDTSEKARIPAWCDRVLWKGANLHQIHYGTADIRFSDHRPVWATFNCMISVINEARRSNLRRILYNENQYKVNRVWHTGIGEDISEVFDLPLASSELQQWWLGNSTSARSVMQQPDGSIVNPNRKSNPFLLADIEADWVPWLPSIGMQKGSEGRVAPSGEVVNTAPSRLAVGNHAVGSSEITGIETSSCSPGGKVSNIGSAPPVPRKPANLGMMENQQTAPAMGTTGYINADMKPLPKGNLWQRSSRPHRLPIDTVEGDSDAPIIENGNTVQSPLPSESSQGKEVLCSFDTLSFGHQKMENDPRDLLGGDVDEEVSWRPLLR